MLENLDKIDWSNLGHAYGPADDVPDLLRSLASDDEDERSNAIYELHGNIWHQGTVYQATAHAVPFLLELLESPKVEGKDEILVLLADLARGTSYHDVHQHLSHHEEEAKGQDWQNKIQKELGWVSDVKAAVKAGEKLYLGFLNDNDARLRDTAAYLLASLGPSAKLAEAVWKRLEKEKEECVQVSLALAFGNLAEHTEANTSPLLAMLLNSPSKSMKLATAMSLVELSPYQQSSESIAALVDAAQSQEGFGSFDESIWGQADSLELLVFNRINDLGANAMLAVITAFISALPERSPLEANRIAEILLRIGFRNSKQRDKTFAQLSEQQQRIVNLIAGSQNLWTEKVGKDSKSALRISAELRSCGLPDDQAKLRAFVDGVAMPPPLTLEQKRPGFGDRLKNFFGRGGR